MDKIKGHPESLGKKIQERNKKEKVWWKYTVSLVIFVIYLLPIYVLVVMSFKEKTDFSSRLLLPDYLYLDNYIKALKEGGFLNALKNTCFVTALTVGIIVILGCMAAYPLSRNRSRLNSIIKSICMGVMMIPSLSILVGVYTEIVSMNGVNCFWPVIVIGAAFGLPTAILLYSNFINSIPSSLDEAAALDGASPFKTFWHVILPQLKPVTATLVIQQGVGAWNNFVYPSYFLQKPAKYTLVLLIRQYFGTADSGSNLNGAAAVAILSTLPIVVLYILMQKYFIQGQIDGAVK